MFEVFKLLIQFHLKSYSPSFCQKDILVSYETLLRCSQSVMDNKDNELQRVLINKWEKQIPSLRIEKRTRGHTVYSPYRICPVAFVYVLRQRVGWVHSGSESVIRVNVRHYFLAFVNKKTT